MPPPSYLQPSYFGAMDQSSYFAGLDQLGPVYNPLNTMEDGMDSGLGPTQLGMTNNPMQNQMQALQAKIREGASKIEFEFMGRQKGSSQATTPETYGKEEREMMRKLAALNKMKTSTHATFTVSGLAGFNPQQGGFNKQAQHETIHEVERAIDFARDATTGGAIVVHTGEWKRPVSHFYGEKGRIANEGFNLYEGEDEEEGLFVVDPHGGRVINIWPGQPIVAPRYHTAKTYAKDLGKPVVGPGKDVEGNDVIIEPDDYVDMLGRKITDPTDPKQAFKRVPMFKEVDGERDIQAGFAAESRDWYEDIIPETEKFNEQRRAQGKDPVAPEVYAARLQLENQVLQSKGQSTFYLTNYRTHEKRLRAINQALRKYEEYREHMSKDEAEEKLKYTEQIPGMQEFHPGQETDIITHLKEEQQDAELSLLHAHEASSAADARAKELEDQMERLDSVEKYGLKESGRALAKLAHQAMMQSKRAREMRKDTDEQWEDLYIAPENWHPGEYGSHPQELFKIIKTGREEFVDRLKREGIKQEEAQELAKKHIKTTLDIGHFNMWRNMMDKEVKDEKGNHVRYLDEKELQDKFNNWLFNHLKKFDEEGMIGHLHLTDNFGFNDEHLSLGQGNAPVKEFVKFMQERGYDDFIIEPGSFNPTTIMADAWSYLGATNWTRKGPQFRQMHDRHFGFYAPPNYHVGAYVPSNEWTLWSQVPLE